MRGKDLPIEFSSMGFTPEPWAPQDGLSILPYISCMFPSYPNATLPPDAYFETRGRLKMGAVHPGAGSNNWVVAKSKDGLPPQALSVGSVETWKVEKVSIWHPGWHDNPFGIRLTALMISRKIPDSSVPMSLLADHPNVQFSYLRSGIGTCEAEMH
jgi:hypothetical protein